MLGLTRIDTLIGTHHKKSKRKKKPFRAFPSGVSATLHPVLPTISWGSKKQLIISLNAHDFVLSLNAPWISLSHVTGTYSWCPSTSWVYSTGTVAPFSRNFYNVNGYKFKNKDIHFLNHGFTMDTLNSSQYDFELIAFFKIFKNILCMMILNISNVVQMLFIFCWENENIVWLKLKIKP